MSASTKLKKLLPSRPRSRERNPRDAIGSRRGLYVEEEVDYDRFETRKKHGPGATIAREP